MNSSAATFATTHWSVVLAAGQSADARASEALEELCRTYWYPLYAYVRRRGYGPEDAQDLTQSFFVHLLRKDFLADVAPAKGKFRSFLLACLKHFLADEWEKRRTAKRGGAALLRPLDFEEAEARFGQEATTEADAEKLFERRWALHLLDHVLTLLGREADTAGRSALFDQIQGCLLGERTTQTYAELGTRLGLSESAVKVTVHRLRQRYRELLRGEIARTVARPEDVEEELRYLFAVVSR